MKKLMPLACLIGLSACSGDAVSDPSEWSCENLIEPVIAMSEEHDLTVLEITDPTEDFRMYGPKPYIDCSGSAEWTVGSGSIEYGARVTDGDNIVLHFQQR